MKKTENRQGSHNPRFESEYWQEFYATTGFSESSSFCKFIKTIPELPNAVLDIGCGQGRDSIAFASAGRKVLGLDRSIQGIEQARLRASTLGVSDQVDFLNCDVADNHQVINAIHAIRARSINGKVLFYMRFFLHSVPESIQNQLVQTISNNSVPGDIFAAEFRTNKDANQVKAFGTAHYRRYQNAADFSRQLAENYGWTKTIFEIESNGLSVYGEEDPILYRVVVGRE